MNRLVVRAASKYLSMLATPTLPVCVWHLVGYRQDCLKPCYDALLRAPTILVGHCFIAHGDTVEEIARNIARSGQEAITHHGGE